VGEIAKKNVPVLDEECPTLEAALLLSQSTTPLPVIGKDGKLSGMLSRRILLSYLKKQAGF
jgi:CBS domain-containing protein